ncbi:MAG: UDP-N-acetylmuramate--L-alanine ligase [Christensenellales bacterium]|jgi:UDP-N-acetylmuramate--alanine ligase
MHIIDKIDRIHFIGIGGISMSALAKLMCALGKKVSGSDANYSPALVELTECGIDAYIGSDPKKLEDAGLVVYSSAVPRDDAELSCAYSLNIPAAERFVFLGEVASYYDKCIAVAGTHGKTTVTAMIAHLLKRAGKSFTAHIGGYAKEGIGNMYIAGREYFLTEACEYKKSLLSLSPYMSIVLNAEYDHPDTYRDLAEVHETFNAFLNKTKPQGKKIVCGDCDYYRKNLIGRSDIITYGLEEKNLFRASEIKEYKKGYFSFKVSYDNREIFEIFLNIIGEFNIYNALAAAAAARILGIEKAVIEETLSGFCGVKRRFQKMGQVNGGDVYIDYAHHPREIEAVLAAAEKIKKARTLIVFQPHTYSRTSSLINEFVECFKHYDELYIVKSYSSREQPEQGMTALDLYRHTAHKGNVQYFDNIVELAKYLSCSVRKDDQVLILGAGDIDCLAELIID